MVGDGENGAVGAARDPTRTHRLPTAIEVRLQRARLAVERGRLGTVLDDVVGRGEPLLSTRLGRDDRLDLSTDFPLGSFTRTDDLLANGQ